MKLYLVRHGIAIDRIGGEVKNDFQRHLTAEGHEETKLVAQALKKMGVRPDLLVSSPLVRARQTAEIFRDVLAQGKLDLTVNDLLAPGGNKGTLLASLKTKNAEEIMFFGHEPDMTYLAQALLLLDSELDMPFKKAGVCRIDVADLPPTRPGRLKWFINPRIAKLIR